MLLAIPIGYFVATLLLVSGVYSGVDFLLNSPDTLTGPDKLHGLVINCWPVIAASALLLLIQINKQLEKLRLAVHYAPAPSAATVKKKAKKAEAAEEDSAPMGQQVVTTPNLASLAQPAPATVTPMYPNSPIPGGGRVPQASAIPPTQITDHTQGGKRAPRKGESTGLSYFKVD
ncbi:MAG: hypothetical protein IKY92_06400 [Akkermansia sp.]|nr:hypothetical protein [Akkermansia sp.]